MFLNRQYYSDYDYINIIIKPLLNISRRMSYVDEYNKSNVEHKNKSDYFVKLQIYVSKSYNCFFVNILLNFVEFLLKMFIFLILN